MVVTTIGDIESVLAGGVSTNPPFSVMAYPTEFADQNGFGALVINDGKTEVVKCSIVGKTTTIKPLDEKYMPLLTSPNGKKFKITVDDSGTISATEATS